MGGRATLEGEPQTLGQPSGCPNPPTPADMAHTLCLQRLVCLMAWGSRPSVGGGALSPPGMPPSTPLPSLLPLLPSRDRWERGTSATLSPPPPACQSHLCFGFNRGNPLHGLHLTVCLTCPSSRGAASLGPPGTDRKYPNE